MMIENEDTGEMWDPLGQWRCLIVPGILVLSKTLSCRVIH